MPPQKKKSKTQSKRKTQPNMPPKTVTCPHCRYERPAGEIYCSICGYPWPWTQ